MYLEEWKLTRERVKNEIYAIDKKEVDLLKEKLSNASYATESIDKANIYWKLSEKYTMLFWGYAEETNIFKNSPKEEYYKQIAKEYLWNSIYYREKCLRIIKENNLIEANDGIFTDIGLKHRYFIEYNYEEIKEEGFWFERFGYTNNESLNIVINDLEYAKRGLYYKIKNYEKEKNYEELFIWCEVMGDLYLIIQLLLIKGGRKDLLDNAKQSLKYFIRSRDSLKVFQKPSIAYGGIYGLPYQINFYDPLLKSFGFQGFSQSSIDKMEFIEKVLLKKESGMDYMEYLESPFFDNKTILNNKIEILINKHPVLKHKGLDFEDWKIVLNFVHNEVLSHNYEYNDLYKEVVNWRREDDMQKWLQRLIDRYLINERNKPRFSSGRERKSGGGNCDHYYKNIPICDKWKRDKKTKPYPTKIYDFIDKVYNDHYEQVKSYANQVKLAVMVVIDSREETKKKIPDLVKDCYDIKINEQDGIITAIFLIQISDIKPSKRI